jgi:superfamily II DNA or RNA helicase
LISLRPYQEQAIATLRRSLAERIKRPMLMAPTGAGKTVLMTSIAAGALAKGKRVIIVVPALELIDQTVRALGKAGIHAVGVIQAQHPLTDAAMPVQVASLDTLRRRMIPDADVVLIDEAHRMSKFLVRWMSDEAWAHVPFIGFSATPWSKGLGRLYQRLIVATTTERLIADGFLSPFRVFAPSKPDLTKVRTKGGDYQLDDLAEVMSDKALTADIVRTWLERGQGRPTLCFAVDRVHAKTLREQFAAAGVATGYIDGMTPPEERNRVRKAFASGEYQVVCNVGVLTTGVDWDVRCIILARPTKSEILYTQIVGRGLRIAEGKDDCLILDHSDTTMRLGFVTDIHHAHLDGGAMVENRSQVDDRVRQPVECPSCHYVRKPGIGHCPACGHVSTTVTEVEVRDGRLVEVSAARKANRSAEWAEKISFIRQLKAYQIETGKASGWVAHKYKAKFGVFPNDPRVRDPVPAWGVTPEVRAWIKSQAIRYAKGQQTEDRVPA